MNLKITLTSTFLLRAYSPILPKSPHRDAAVPAHGTLHPTGDFEAGDLLMVIGHFFPALGKASAATVGQLGSQYLWCESMFICEGGSGQGREEGRVGYSAYPSTIPPSLQVQSTHHPIIFPHCYPISCFPPLHQPISPMHVP